MALDTSTEELVGGKDDSAFSSDYTQEAVQTEVENDIIITYMWLSWVEIKHYSVAYFNCVTAFKVL